MSSRAGLDQSRHLRPLLRVVEELESLPPPLRSLRAMSLLCLRFAHHPAGPGTVPAGEAGLLQDVPEDRLRAARAIRPQRFLRAVEALCPWARRVLLELARPGRLRWRGRDLGGRRRGGRSWKGWRRGGRWDTGSGGR